MLLRHNASWLAGNGPGGRGTPRVGRKLAHSGTFRQGRDHGTGAVQVSLKTQIERDQEPDRQGFSHREADGESRLDEALCRGMGARDAADCLGERGGTGIGRRCLLAIANDSRSV
jgi:hypothetical protein